MATEAYTEQFKRQFGDWEKTIEKFAASYLNPKYINTFTTTLKNFHFKEQRGKAFDVNNFN